MSLSWILKGTCSRDMRQWLFWSPSGFSGLGIATVSALLQVFGIYIGHAGSEEFAKPKVESRPCGVCGVWTPGKLGSNPSDFSGFRRLRAAARSSDLKGSEILWHKGLYQSQSPLGLRWRSDRWSRILCPSIVLPTATWDTLFGHR